MPAIDARKLVFVIIWALDRKVVRSGGHVGQSNNRLPGEVTLLTNPCKDVSMYTELIQAAIVALASAVMTVHYIYEAVKHLQHLL